ncbi:unnamed protein product [Calypogeia fissa]
MDEENQMESPFPEGSMYKDGIYYSKWPTEPIPTDPYLDLTTYVLDVDPSYIDSVALVDAPTGESMTFREMKHKVYAVASGLADVGVKQGDVVMILSLNGLHSPIIMFAILAIGAVVTATNPANLISEIAKQAKDSGTKFVMSSPDLVEKVAGLKLPIILIDTMVGTDVPEQVKGITPIGYLSEIYKGDPSRAPKMRIRQRDTAMLLYSSGTTGVSKGVILSHRNVIAAAACRDPGDVRDNHRTFLAAIPMYHVFGMIILCVIRLKYGCKLVIAPKFDFAKFLEAIERYRISHLPVVPPILLALVKSPLSDKYDLSSLQFMGSGAAPLGKELMALTAKKFKGVNLGEGYGLTETCGLGAYVPSVATSTVPFGSVGFLVPHMHARIVDLYSGKPLPPNEKGELWLRGPAIMEGYLNNEKATAETLDKDGWLHTGDIARIDDNGCFFIVDRLKELIKYNGLQVAPAELEAILISHPEIEDGAVAGFPDEQTGQIPVAFVVRRSTSLSEDDVMSFVAKQVASYKKVRKVIFVQSIPKSEAGKILRKELKALPVSKL